MVTKKNLQHKIIQNKELELFDYEYQSIQIKQALIIFQYETKEVKKIRSILNRPEISFIDHIPSKDQKLIKFSLLNFKDKLVILTGGTTTGRGKDGQDETYALNVEREQWNDVDELPHLNTKRQGHSSCADSNSIFVVGGDSVSEKFLSSIEMLDLRLDPDGSFGFVAENWVTVNSSPEYLRECAWPLLVPIKSDLLLIYGGHHRLGEKLIGVHILNKDTKQVDIFPAERPRNMGLQPRLNNFYRSGCWIWSRRKSWSGNCRFATWSSKVNSCREIQ